jgi:predicted transcriptional regulator
MERPMMSAPESDEAFAAAVREGIADAAAGRVVPFKEVRKWLKPWGKPDARPASRVQRPCVKQ